MSNQTTNADIEHFNNCINFQCKRCITISNGIPLLELSTDSKDIIKYYEGYDKTNLSHQIQNLLNKLGPEVRKGKQIDLSELFCSHCHNKGLDYYDYSNGSIPEMGVKCSKCKLHYSFVN